MTIGAAECHLRADIELVGRYRSDRNARVLEASVSARDSDLVGGR